MVLNRVFENLSIVHGALNISCITLKDVFNEGENKSNIYLFIIQFSNLVEITTTRTNDQSSSTENETCSNTSRIL